MAQGLVMSDLQEELVYASLNKYREHLAEKLMADCHDNPFFNAQNDRSLSPNLAPADSP